MKTNKLKSSDLRIGNWVKCDNLLCKIVEIYSEDIYCYDQFGEDLHNIEYIQPIELTEEVLLKIGFKKVFQSKITKGRFELNVNIGDNEFTNIEYNIFVSGEPNLNITQRRCESLCDNSICKQNIKYLHQLQNAYYLLTNEELEVEL